MAKQEHEIYGITYITPHVPPYNDIYGSEKNKKQQKFERVVIPDSFFEVEYDENGVADYSPSQIEFIEQQQHHIEHGCWFMNNGTPTYITGLHYFYLNFWVLDTDVYPDYRDADRKWFYFQDYCEKQRFVDGVIRVKKRREGATSQAACSLVYDAIMNTVAFCGIVSKDKDTASSVFNDMVAHGYRNLPEFLKVRCEDENSKTKLIFRAKGSKSAKQEKKKGQLYSNSLGLGSRIDFKPTKLNSYDGSRLTKLLIDECFAPGTKILCEGGVFRNIEDIRVGDKVIVEGGKVVEVGKTCEGYDEMYLVKQPYSQDYIVNSKHRLYLEQRCSTNGIKDDGIKIITPVDFLNIKGKYRKRTTYGVRSRGIEFGYFNPTFDPYLFGLWIGDGHHDDARFIVNRVDDKEILSYLEDFAGKNNFRIGYHYSKQCKKCVNILLTDSNNRWKPNSLLEELVKLGVYKNKRIPKEFLLASMEVRKKVLAGIIDTDGHLPKEGVYDIAMSRKELIEDIVFLCRSIGLSVSKIKHAKTNFGTDSYKISISGKLSDIPVLLPRKCQAHYKQSYAYRRNRIEVSPIGIGKYHGITLIADNDDDRRLILEDFTISMNCAKWDPEVPIDEYWPIVQKTMKRGLIRVGFALLPSTTNRGEKGGTGFRKIWDDSNHFKSERTGSGLFRYFAPADEGYEGFIDEYGISITSKPTPEQSAYLRKKFGLSDEESNMTAREYILKKRSLIRNPVALKKEILDYPLTEKEAFDFSEDSNIYNTGLLNEQREYLVEKNIKLRTVRFFQKADGAVDFVDDPSGLWKILYLPKDGETNASYTRNGKKSPANTHKYTISVDPYKSTIKVGPGSMGAAFIWSKLNPIDPHNTGMPIAMFWGRPRLRNMFHEQMILAAIYYGADLVYESDYDDYVEFLMERGWIGYVKEKPVNAIDPNRKKKRTVKEYGVKSANSFEYAAVISASTEYVELYSEKIYFLDLIDDLLNYDPDKRTDHDLAVAFQIGCLAIQAPVKKKEVVVKHHVVRKFDLTKQ